jgi:hypothetical protein
MFILLQLSDRAMIPAVNQILRSVLELDKSRHFWLCVERLFALDDEEF